MQGVPSAFGGSAMGVQEIPDNVVKNFLLTGRERHSKQSQFKWFMLHKADQVAGFPFPEVVPFVKTFNQGEPPGNHGKDIGCSFPYLKVVALFMLAVMIDNCRAE